MRSFYFVAKNIGAHERYLTYVLGEGMDIDEDVLDYCEENFPPEILKIIYEEDDDFDYLSYDVSDLVTLEKFTEGNMNKETVLKILRNVAIGMINIKEYAIPMSYVLLNKSFMYIDPDNLDITFLYLPVEGDASVSAEFKSFVRQFIAHMKFNIDEDVSFVGQLLTYINGDGFNLRGLIGLSEALMQDAGIGFMSEVGISAEDGTEVVGNADMDDVAEAEPEKKASDFMKDLGEADDAPLPEIGDDEEEEALEDVTEAAAAAEIPAEPAPEPEPEPEPIPEPAAEPKAEEKDIELSDAAPEPEPAPVEEEHEETLDELKERLEGILEGKKPPKKQPPKKPEPPKKPAVRVSRAAMLKEKAEEIAEEDAEHAAVEAEAAASAAPEAPAEEKTDKKAKKEKEAEAPAAAEVAAAAEAGTERANAQPTEVVNNTIIGTQGAAIKINPYLIRNDNHERIMITKAVFKIGKASRGVDYHIGGNSAISRQHCVILHKGDSYYLKDNKSTNHTYLDGRQLETDEEALLKNKAVITLGDEDFTFMEG